MSNKEDVINEKRKTTIEKPEFNIAWEGKPSGLKGRILSFLHLNFTTYKISKDELIIVQGFFNRRTDTVELYQLKDPDLRETLWQRLFKVGTIRVTVDKDSKHQESLHYIELKNIKTPDVVRKLLRDYIEADVMERGIQYFDRV